MNIIEINGQRINIVPPNRVMTPSKDFRRLQSPELVKDLDAWMEEFFGYVNAIPPDVGAVKDYLHCVTHMNQWDVEKLLPEGLFMDNDGALFAECRVCERAVEWDPTWGIDNFDQHMVYCGGSAHCCP